MADETGIDRLENEQPSKLNTLPAVKIRFLRQLFEQKAITKSHKGIDINFPLVKKTLDTLDIDPFSYGAYMQRVAQLPSITPPADFNWDAQARKSVRESIRILHESGIVDRNLLVDASKFAGPGNTNIKNLKGDVGGLDTFLYQSHGRESLPVPKSKAERDEFISLSVDKEGVIFTARHIRKLTQDTNQPLSEDQAIQLALAVTSAHEYGHAIFLALKTRGTITKNTSQSWIDKIRNDDAFVQDEHFARGIEDIVLKKALTELAGYSNENANEILLKIREERQAYQSLMLDLIRSAGYHGFTWKDIKTVEKMVSRELTSDKKERNIADQFIDIVAYNLPPHSAEELNNLSTLTVYTEKS